LFEPYLKSRVGQRLFLSFLVAALIPMAGVAWYAYDRVSDLLLEVNYRRLTQDSKSFGMSVLDELGRRAHALTGLAEVPRRPPPGFSTLAAQPRPELDRAAGQHLDRGRPLLRLDPGGRATMVAAIRGSDQVVSAELDRRGLWENDSSPEHYCVLNASFAPLFCTPGLVPPKNLAWAELVLAKNSGVFPWRIGQEDYLAGFWHTHHLAAFASPGLVVMVATPKAMALADLSNFRHIFPAIAVLALALAAGLAGRQIRSHLEPLERLTEGTRRLSTGDLTARVNLSGRDEFANLGQTFNGMARTLEYRFHMLGMLAELDRAILNASDIDQVTMKILAHIGQAIPCDGAAVYRLEEHGMGVLLACREVLGEAPSCSQISVVAYDFPAMVTGQPWYRIGPDEPRPAFMEELSALRLHDLMIFPIRVDDKLKSVLILGYQTAPEALSDIVQAGRSLADRLAIAAASFAWEEKLYHQAHHDALTGLPNRILLRDRLEQAIQHASRTHSSVALMLLDLDNFKQVNDTLGHSAGDRLLVEHAQRLRQRVRQGDTVARLGGDEFLILVPDLVRGKEYAALDGMARAFNAALAEPVLLDEQQVVSLASIGIAVYPDNATEIEDLIKMADAAMYESKREQPGGFRFYSGDLNVHASARFKLTQDLREAIAGNELLMYFQPKIEATTGRVAGAEALVRWNSPKRGLVPPGLFVPLLDEMGLGTWLGEWVLDTVCAQMRDWDRQGLAPIPVSINFSPLQFERTPVVQTVMSVLEENGLAPARLEIEILEATAVSESIQVRDTLNQLRDLGFNIALDDFGTGYSSLVYLARIPANVLKLDRAFIQALDTDNRQQEIVKLIIALAQVMEFTVVAEGVETETQLDVLTRMGCNLIQGYLISRPIPADQFAERWLRPDSGYKVGMA